METTKRTFIKDIILDTFSSHPSVIQIKEKTQGSL